MPHQTRNPENCPDASQKQTAYNRFASAHCKGAIYIWCLTGWIYAAATWRLRWLPGILVFVPGIFVASMVAAAFFIPIWVIMKRVRQDWEAVGERHWGLLVAATLLKIGGFVGPIASAIGYVHLLRLLLD